MSAWKPGDVVVFGDDVRAIWQDNQFATADRRYFNEWQLRDARPLLVIDVEDREQIERLMTLYAGSPLTDDEVPDMQAALRSLLTRPRPEEPTGLGAVIEDRDAQYVSVQHMSSSKHRWQHVGDGSVWHWEALTTPVRVLSTGVEEAGDE